MRIYTGRSRLMEPALIEVLRRGMAAQEHNQYRNNRS